MVTTPVTMRTAPMMVRGLTLSTLRKNKLVKSTLKRGVVLRSGMITETSTCASAMKLRICDETATKAAITKKRELRRSMTSKWVLCVVTMNVININSDTVVTVAVAMNGSGRILRPCLRKLCEMAENSAVPNGNATSKSRQLDCPLWRQEMTQTLATTSTVP